jgi:hypothetical protein
MPSITLKRSAATLGVVAGLLVAAAPASAQILDGPLMWETPRTNSLDIKAVVVLIGANDYGFAGTQVGSEGVKAPKPPASSEEPTESISFNYLKAAGTETGNPER